MRGAQGRRGGIQRVELPKQGRLRHALCQIKLAHNDTVGDRNLLS